MVASFVIPQQPYKSKPPTGQKTMSLCKKLDPGLNCGPDNKLLTTQDDKVRFFFSLQFVSWLPHTQRYVCEYFSEL